MLLQHHFIYMCMMLSHSIVLSLALLHQFEGSQIGSPDKDTKQEWLAWKNSDGHHAPPGHVKSKSSEKKYLIDRTKHAWAGKENLKHLKMPKTHVKAPILPEPVGVGMAKKVLKSENTTRKALQRINKKVEEENNEEFQYPKKLMIDRKTNSDLASSRSKKRNQEQEQEQELEQDQEELERDQKKAEKEKEEEEEEEEDEHEQKQEQTEEAALASIPDRYEEDTKGQWLAWKDADGHHLPPGRLASSESSDMSEHAWAGNKKPVTWKRGMLNTRGRDLGSNPKRVLQHQEDEEEDGEGLDSPQRVMINGPGKMHSDLESYSSKKIMINKKAHSDLESDSSEKVMINTDSTKVSSDLESDSSTGGSADLESESESDSSTAVESDLQGTLEQDCMDSINLEQFMPLCLKHTKSLIADLDFNYGDAQLETILRNWCSSAEEFPNTRGARKVIGFRNHQSCFDFADDLKKARYSELKSTSDAGYRKFCTAFYGHHGGFAAPAPPPPATVPPPPRYSSASFAGLSMAVMSLTLSFV